MRKFLAPALKLPAVLSLACGAFASAGAGCAPAFHDAKTPSWQWCSDMPVVLNGQADPERPFHRIKPISTPIKSLTAPERLEALRVEACKLGGDAVINAGDEETQTPDHTIVVRASGYAIRWTNIASKTSTFQQGAGPQG